MDPHINPATGVWDDNYYAQQQNGSGAGSDAVDKYVNNLLSNAHGQLDVTLKTLDAQHKLALGNDDTESAKFLEQVANSLESQIGRVPYDYQKYSNRELQQYSMGNQNIADNKQLALDRLANDERTGTNSLNYNQANQNQSTIESLSQRGLADGQALRGGIAQGYNGAPISGAVGAGGVVANNQNQDFANQRDVLNSGNALNVRGTNLDYGQQQKTLDFNHANTMTDLTDQGRRDAQDAQNSFNFGSQSANLGFQNTQNSLENQRAALLRQNQILNGQLAGRSTGILGY